MRVFSSLVFVLMMLAVMPVSSAQSPEAQAAYQAGHYALALDLAEQVETADNLAFAARTVLAEGIGADRIDMDEARLAEAAQFAERALVLDPRHDEARLQKAIVLSLRARTMGTRPAYRARLGQTARDLGEAVVEDAPDNAYAHGFLAVWHVEVIRRGGRLGALFLGANMSKAQAHYEIAARLSPSDAALHWQWARALSALNPAKYPADIDMALTRVENAVPADQLSAALQARALRFRDARVDMSADDIRQMAIALL